MVYHARRRAIPPRDARRTTTQDPADHREADDEPCPDDACPHPARLHDERIRAGGGHAPCSSCAVCAADDAPSAALLCDACFEDRTGELAQCEDGCDLPLDHDGMCGPRPAGAATQESCDECGEVGRLHVVDPEEEYDHSRAKEDARNAALREDLDDDPECPHCGDPVRHGSGAAVTCDVCGSFCCEDHHLRHPAYGTHGLGAARSVSDVPAAHSASDATALDRIARILRDPGWGVGMLEDIGEIVTGTGRSIANLPGDGPTWGRH